MKRGLVIGKFLPIHQGHIALIRFAASWCDELIVSMSSTPADAIDPDLRLTWIKEIFKHEPAIKPAMIVDDFDDATLPWPQRITIWADFIKRTYPSIDILFSSEAYGPPLAASLGIDYKSFDVTRTQHPISATLIRQTPFRYWQFIPDAVKPYFVKKICFYGPESTGKSTMAQQMAAKYNTVFVPEVARELITSNDFTAADIVRIGEAHYVRIQQHLKHANKILICDTDAITTQIYSQHYLGIVPDVLYEWEAKVKFDHYFLFDIDVPWVADDMRDLGERRAEMFLVFRDALIKRNIPYTLVQGDYTAREQLLTASIDKILNDETVTTL